MADLAKQMCHSRQTQATYYDAADRDLRAAVVAGTIQTNLVRHRGQAQVSHLGHPSVYAYYTLSVLFSSFLFFFLGGGITLCS
jgi:hypothetical protein